MPVLRTGTEWIFWQLSRKEEGLWHSFHETTVYMKEHFTTFSKGIGLKAKRSFLILSVYLFAQSGLNDIKTYRK